MKLLKYPLILLFFLSAQLGAAQDRLRSGQGIYSNINSDSTEVQKKTVQAIYSRFGPGIRIRLGVNKGGIINGLMGTELNKGLTEVDPVKRVFQFLEFNRDIFQIENVKEQFVIAKGDPKEMGESIIIARQIEKGVEVTGGLYIFNFSKDSKGAMLIQSLFGNFYPDARGISTIPAVSEKAAGQIALSDTICKGQNASLYKSPSLVIKFYNNIQKLVWVVSLKNIKCCGLNEYGFAIDAQNGNVLDARCYEQP